MLQLVLVTHINREQMAAQVVEESERGRITSSRHDKDGWSCRSDILPLKPQKKVSSSPEHDTLRISTENKSDCFYVGPRHWVQRLLCRVVTRRK